MAIIKSADHQIFYDWEDIASEWIIDENKFDADFPSKPQDPGTSVPISLLFSPIR